MPSSPARRAADVGAGHLCTHIFGLPSRRPRVSRRRHVPGPRGTDWLPAGVSHAPRVCIWPAEKQGAWLPPGPAGKADLTSHAPLSSGVSELTVRALRPSRCERVLQLVTKRLLSFRLFLGAEAWVSGCSMRRTCARCGRDVAAPGQSHPLRPGSPGRGGCSQSCGGSSSRDGAPPKHASPFSHKKRGASTCHRVVSWLLACG